jgi:predicted nucleic acid-binding protein
VHEQDHQTIIADTTFASDFLREQTRGGGENDNWIAGFARYYREPLITRDPAFDGVPEVRRLPY